MTASFKIYLEKYSNGEVDQNFYLYNTLSRGPKAIPVESPKPPSNPYMVVKYSDPILKKNELFKNDGDDDYVDKAQSDDDGDDPHCSHYQLFEFADTDMLDISDLIAGADLDFLDDGLNDANLLSDDLLNEKYSTREESFSVIKNISERSDIFDGFKISSDLDSLLKMDITPNSKTPEILGLRNDNISIKKSFESNEDNEMFIRISCEAGPSFSERIRRSELNDLKPDPKKLLKIGFEINRIFEQYNDSNSQEHHSNLPIKKSTKNKKTAFKRLKSQLGSKICRLKKKASVEANKIFFNALQKEQENLLLVMKTMLETLLAEIGDFSNNPSSSDHLSRLNSLIQEHLDDMTAGYHTSCVRKILISEAKRILTENNETFLSDSE